MRLYKKVDIDDLWIIVRYVWPGPMKIICCQNKHDDTKVVDRETTEKRNSTQRECENAIFASPLWKSKLQFLVIKKIFREQYRRDKVEGGWRACADGSQEQVSNLIDTQAIGSEWARSSSKDIGEGVMEGQKLDEVAYIRFASCIVTLRIWKASKGIGKLLDCHAENILQVTIIAFWLQTSHRSCRIKPDTSISRFNVFAQNTICPRPSRSSPFVILVPVSLACR